MRNLDFFSEIKIAHKGLHEIDKGIFENTIVAFEKAVQKGYPIELDIHLTKDRKIVVMHDNNLLEMTGIDKRFDL